MIYLESQKYQAPKFSSIIKPLSDLVSPKINPSRTSKQSSRKVTRESSSYNRSEEKFSFESSLMSPSINHKQNNSVTQDANFMLKTDNLKFEKRKQFDIKSKVRIIETTDNERS